MAERRVVGAAPGFCDPAGVKEIYVEDIGDIQIVGGVIKVDLVVTRNHGNGPERETACRLVAPSANVPLMLMQVISALLGRPFMSADVSDFTLKN